MQDNEMLSVVLAVYCDQIGYFKEVIIFDFVQILAGIKVALAIFFSNFNVVHVFYKHNVYKHTDAQISKTLSIS